MAIEEEVDKFLEEREDNPTPLDTLAQFHQHTQELEQQRKLVDEDTDRPEQPEGIGETVLKYHKQAEISGQLEEEFDVDVAFHGTHVVNSNTKRIDNLRHLGELDSTNIVRHIPYLRQRGTDTKIETTSEFQMCRSNPEIGGFDQKMARTNITKEDVDMKQQQTITGKDKQKGGGILGLFHLGRKT